MTAKIRIHAECSSDTPKKAIDNLEEILQDFYEFWYDLNVSWKVTEQSQKRTDNEP